MGGGRYLLSFAELLIQVGDLLSKTGELWCGESRESQPQASEVFSLGLSPETTPT